MGEARWMRWVEIDLQTRARSPASECNTQPHHHQDQSSGSPFPCCWCHVGIIYHRARFRGRLLTHHSKRWVSPLGAVHRGEEMSLTTPTVTKALFRMMNPHRSSSVGLIIQRKINGDIFMLKEILYIEIVWRFFLTVRFGYPCTICQQVSSHSTNTANLYSTTKIESTLFRNCLKVG